MKYFTTTAALLTAGLMVGGTAQGTVLIDDDFDNGDIATGGINGGFGLITNGAGVAGSIGEAGTDATLTSGGGTIVSSNNIGITSNNSFDISSQSEGIVVTYVVSSVDATPSIEVQGPEPGDPSTFQGFKTTSFWIDNDQNFDFTEGLFAVAVSDGSPAIGPGDVRIFIDSPEPGASVKIIAGAGAITFDDSTIDDGYTVKTTLTPDGWSVEFIGLGSLTNNSSSATVTSNVISAAWGTDADDANYSNIFDSTAYVAALQQAPLANSATIDRITVEAVPEPGSLALLALGGVACLRRRRG